VDRRAVTPLLLIVCSLPSCQRRHLHKQIVGHLSRPPIILDDVSPLADTAYFYRR
jgi:hypothetical protein